jgi:hypothetical protein
VTQGYNCHFIGYERIRASNIDFNNNNQPMWASNTPVLQGTLFQIQKASA